MYFKTPYFRTRLTVLVTLGLTTTPHFFFFFFFKENTAQLFLRDLYELF